MADHKHSPLTQLLLGIAPVPEVRANVDLVVVEFNVAIDAGPRGGQLEGRTAIGSFSYDRCAFNSYAGFARLKSFEMDFFGLGKLHLADIEHAGFYLNGRGPLAGDTWNSNGLLGTDILLASFNQNAPGGFRYFDRSNYSASAHSVGYSGTVTLWEQVAVA